MRHFSAIDKVIRLFISGCALSVLATYAGALGNPPSWTEEMAKGRFPYHRLTAADFPINDAVHKEYAMHTEGFFWYHYNERWTENGGHAIARITDWNVWSGFERDKSSRKSWLRKDQVERTLPHEQGHLDINELFSKRLADTPLEKLPTGEGNSGKEAEADLARKMKAKADRLAAEEKVEQERYDAETNHGANAAKQQAWTAAIQTRLQHAGIHY